MKILVTGAEGQLGRSIQELAKKLNHLDFIFTDYNELDITNSTKVYDFFQGDRFDYCINCAAYTAVDKAETDSENAFLINAEAVKNLAEACKANNVVLLQISTDFVFDGRKKTPYNEEDEPNPLNVYGLSKLKGEKYVQNIMRKYFVIRTSWVYSNYGHNFVKTMLRLGAEKDEINVVNDQIGSPTYAGDLAELLMSIIVSNSKKYGIYHYSNSGEISWHDFALKIFEIVGFKIKVNPVTSNEFPTIAERPKFSILDCMKSHNYLQGPIKNWEIVLKKVLVTK